MNYKKLFAKTMGVIFVLGLISLSVVANSSGYVDWDDSEAVAMLDAELNSIYTGTVNTNIKWMDRTDIQEFLEQHSGPMKDFEEMWDTNIISAANTIEQAGAGWGFSINNQLFVIFLELKWSLLSDVNSFVNQARQDLLDLFQRKENTQNILFIDAIVYLRTQLNEYYIQSPQEQLLNFKNNTSIELPPDLEKGTYAILKVLADLADTKEQWQEWTGTGNDSFLSTYQSLFLKSGLGQDWLDYSTTETSTRAFLVRKPFDENSTVNSFFDHDRTVNGIMSRFDGLNLQTSGYGIQGVNSYDKNSGTYWHDGIDYGTGTKELYATHGGVIKRYEAWKVYDCDSDGVDDFINRVDILNEAGTHRTTYWHLILDGTNSLEQSWQVGDTINVGDYIGTSGTDNCSTGAHLHFAVTDPESFSTEYDPFGYWTENGNQEESFWQSSNIVDDEDVGFQHFRKVNFEWLTQADVGHDDSDSLYRYTTYNPTDKWENWGFWTGTLAEAGEHEVFAYIPNYAITGIEATTQAKYYIYHSEGKTEKIIDQNTHQGEWVSLGKYNFESGSKSAVQLVDEVNDASEANKIIWADAVKWEKVVETPHLSLTPTIHAKASGGYWSDVNTWDENRIPNENDVVEINGVVNTHNATVAGLVVSEIGVLQSNCSVYNKILIINDTIINNGIIQSNFDCPEKFYLEIAGNIENNGTWNNYKTILIGTDARTITTNTTIESQYIDIAGDFELTDGNPTFTGAVDFDYGANGHTITVISPQIITFGGTTHSSNGTFIGPATIKLTGDLHYGTVFTTEKVILNKSGIISTYTNVTINGDLEITNGTTLQNYNYSSSCIFTINGNIINNGTIKNNDNRGTLSISTSGNIENNRIWSPYTTKLLTDVEILNSTTLHGSIDHNDNALIVNSPNTVILSNSVNGVITYNGTGNIILQGNLSSGNISGTIAELHISGTSTSMYNTIITANQIIFDGDIISVNLSDNTMNGNVQINDNTIIKSTSGGGRLTINGNILNNGIIESYADTSALSLNISGNIENNGIWNPYRTTLLADVEVLNSTTINGRLDCNENALIINSPNVVNLTNSIYGVDIYNGTGKIVLEGGISNGNILGTITEFYISGMNTRIHSAIIDINQIIFDGDTINIGLSDNIMNGNVKINNNTIIKSSSGGGRLTINGNIINNGVAESYSSGSALSLNISGNIQNNNTWTPYKTTLNWQVITDATTYEFRTANTKRNLQQATIHTTSTTNLYQYQDQETSNYITINSIITNPTTNYWQTRAKLSDSTYTDWTTPQTINVPLNRSLITITPTTHNFPHTTANQESPEQIFTITNTGNQDLQINSFYLNDTTNFNLNINTSDNPCNTTTTITPNNNCTIGIKFTPYTTGTFNKTLIINSNSNNTPHAEITLQGKSGIAGELAYFEFSQIENKEINTPFQITITAKDSLNNTLINSINKLNLHSNIAGKYISPNTIELINGTWTGNIILYRAGKNMYITSSSEDNTHGESNRFTVQTTNNTGNLSGIVQNINEQLLENVEIYLLQNKNDDLLDAIEKQISDTNGRYDFKDISCGEYYLFSLRTIWLPEISYETDLRSVQISCGQTNTRDVIVTSYCEPSDKNPVLLVPGIMGTDEKWRFPSVYPVLPKTQPAPIKDIKIHDPGFFVLQQGNQWEELRDELENNGGYQRGCTIFDVPYDWREDLTDAWVDYLKPAIDYAKLKSKKDKVDIVAHSMGGLLTRAYIQSTEYDNDIDKFAMVGTPNHGSSVAYYLWEGGDPMLADEVQGSADSFVAPYFYTSTLANNYEEHMGEEVCDFDGIIFNDNDNPNYCRENKIHAYLRKHVRSVRQLMPTFENAIMQNGAHKDIYFGENRFLKALNYEDCWNGRDCGYSFADPKTKMIDDNSSDPDKVMARVFAGVGQDTLATIEVGDSIQIVDPDEDAIFYPDGKPLNDGGFLGFFDSQRVDYAKYDVDDDKNVLSWGGDGTVLPDSVAVRFLKKPQDVYQQGEYERLEHEEHPYLLDAFKQEILNFLK
jgi:murein DD-endopeptidase MepM/ murein hydrolase activator NlpD